MSYKIEKTVCETSVGGGNWAGLDCWNGSRCFLKIRAGLESSRLGRTTDWVTIHVTYSCKADFIEGEARFFCCFVFLFFCSTLPLWHNPQLWARAEFHKNEQLWIRVKERRGNLSEELSVTASCRAQPADHIALFPHMMPLVTFYTCSIFPNMNSLSYLSVFVLLNLNLEEGTVPLLPPKWGLDEYWCCETL